MKKTNGAFQDTKSGEFYSASQLVDYARANVLIDGDTFVWKTHRNSKGQEVD